MVMGFIESHSEDIDNSNNARLPPEHAARVVEYFGIVKLLLARGAGFDVARSYKIDSNGEAWMSCEEDSKYIILSCLDVCFPVDIWISDLPSARTCCAMVTHVIF